MSASHDIVVPADLSGLSNGELRKLENKLARKHSGMFPWFMVIWAFANLACWLALWPLVMLDIIPLWLGFVIACINVTLVYLPTHDAQHDIIARPGQKLRWLNEFLGHSTTWILVYPFQVLRVTHLEHHRHTNDAERDPDIALSGRNALHSIWRGIISRQPGGQRTKEYIAVLERQGRQDLILLAIAYKVGFLAILSALAWNGYALEALFLWWLPLQFATTYLQFFLSWAPHHPAQEQGRYRDTRNWKSRFGNVLTLGMQFHIIHHLHPYIPLNHTPAAYRDMRPILEARGCEIEM